MFYGKGFGVGGRRGMGRAFSRGYGMGYGQGRGRGLGPNLSGVCRFDPSMPSRRAMMFGAVNGADMPAQSDIEALKAEAEYLKRELDLINKQIEAMQDNE